MDAELNSIQHIIKDPIYGSIIFDHNEKQFLSPFINHPLFQRLRHIKQLSLAELIFPGAVHTRFSHSLGCCYLASKIYKHLYKEKKNQDFEYEHKLLMLSGLYHDIGHGPFSHTFEELEIFKQKNIKHESWFSYFCNEIFEDILNNESNHNKTHDKTELKKLCNDLIAIFSQDKCPKKYRWIKQLVSSQIDIDRMDYLLRDAHFCGVKYGNFDLEWLISCLVLNKSKQEIMINEKGIGSAEQFLLARRLMHKNIYFNLKANAASCCIIHLLNNLTESNANLSHFIKNGKLFKFLSHAKNIKKPDDLYSTYKSLVDFDIWIVIRELAEEKSNNICNILARNIYHRNLPETYVMKKSYSDSTSSINLTEDITVIGEKIIQKCINQIDYKPWKITVEKRSMYSYKDHEDPIYIAYKDGTIQPLTETSLLIDKISNEEENNPFLYVDYQVMNNNTEKEKIKEIIKNFIV